MLAFCNILPSIITLTVHSDAKKQHINITLKYFLDIMFTNLYLNL